MAYPNPDLNSDEPDAPVDERPEVMADQFRKELEGLINRYSMENGSDTPDFILAGYMADCLDAMTDCLDAFDTAMTAREMWYGRKVGEWNPASN